MLLQSPRSLLATTPNIKLTFNITASLHGLLPRSQSNYGPLFFQWLDISPWYKQTKSASSPACVSTALTFYPTLDSPSLVSSFSSSLFLLRSSRLQTLGFTSQLASFPPCLLITSYNLNHNFSQFLHVRGTPNCLSIHILCSKVSKGNDNSNLPQDL